MIALIPVLIFVAGLLLHALCANATAKEFGRACVWVGLFWSIAPFVRSTVRLFGMGS